MVNPLENIGKEAKSSSYLLGRLSSKTKNSLLEKLAENIINDSEFILSENVKDLDLARKNGLSEALLDRLALSTSRVKSLSDSILSVVSLKDPVGTIIDGQDLENGLSIVRKRVPLGVVAAIYEARPNVTIEIAALCLKTGNASILRGGKETINTNKALIDIIHKTLSSFNIPTTAVQYISNPDRALLDSLLALDGYVDMLIPRGGLALQQKCKELARMPVIFGGIGVCHIFVDSSANFESSIEVILNAKTQRPSTCNSVETLLVHKDIAEPFLGILVDAMSKAGVTLHATKKALLCLNSTNAKVLEVTEQELKEEWISLDLNVHVVSDVKEAVEHINSYGSLHSDSILTENMDNADYFVNSVDSSAVYVNASTRFTDGGEFGLGAEIAVSTQKLHCRGPVGLDGLTTYKWIAKGNYSVRS